MATDGATRWLVLVHQLPTKPSKLRVRIWRRLQAVGAVLVKNSVYVLPNSRETREDIEWIRNEIVTHGGEAMVFAADAVDQLTTDEVVDAFVVARRSDWAELSERATAFAERLDSERDDATHAEVERELKTLRNRAAQIDKIDYFRAPGRNTALRVIEVLARKLSPEPARRATAAPTHATGDFRNRRWLTRPRPGVDRMASAWFIRRFVDPEGAFLFADRIPPDEDLVPFDMFGVAFGHHGEDCTLETLMTSFGIDDPALARIARIVHDLDLRSDSPVDAETSTVGRLVAGLREAIAGDPELLEHGMVVFEALYRAFLSESTTL